MKSIKQYLNVPILALLLIALFVGYKVSGTHYTAIQPTVVAVVRIEPLFAGLKQQADAKGQVKERFQRNKEELERRTKEVESLEAELKDIVDIVIRREKSDVIGLKSLELKSWFASTTAQAEFEKGALLQELYKKICDAAKDMAIANGYSLVLLDDSNSQLEFSTSSRISPRVQVEQKVMGHKVLYVDPMLDITDQLKTRMNNEFIAANAN